MSKKVKFKNPKFCHFSWISESLFRLLEINIFCLDISGFTKDHYWVMTKQYQTKSSLLRPNFRCFWPIFRPNLIFFPFSQVLTPHPNTTLIWGIQEHLSHQWTIFFCLVMLQDQCVVPPMPWMPPASLLAGKVGPLECVLSSPLDFSLRPSALVSSDP